MDCPLAVAFKALVHPTCGKIVNNEKKKRLFFVGFSPNCNNFYFDSDALHDWFHYV